MCRKEIEEKGKDADTAEMYRIWVSKDRKKVRKKVAEDIQGFALLPHAIL